MKRQELTARSGADDFALTPEQQAWLLDERVWDYAQEEESEEWTSDEESAEVVPSAPFDDVYEGIPVPEPVASVEDPAPVPAPVLAPPKPLLANVWLLIKGAYVCLVIHYMLSTDDVARAMLNMLVTAEEREEFPRVTFLQVCLINFILCVTSFVTTFF